MNNIAIRSDIYRLVSSISPMDTIEEEHVNFVLNWIESGIEIFRTGKPATPETHLVSYFVVASPDQSKVLLVDHKKAMLWLPPGGHVEPGEHPKETVSREIKEELDIEAEFLCDEPILLTVTKTVGNVAKHTDVSFWYLLKCDPNSVLNYDADEFNKIGWFGIDEIPYEKSDPHMKRFVEKMLNLLKLNSCLTVLGGK
ncbi:MAG: NUDIX domain-containing protein [Parachlamydiaceae bacterium]|nr:NUDIX domain-containing protein [Parachlamydiaceae bacterium]